LIDRQIVLDGAGRRLEDEVAEVAVISGRGEADRPAGPAQTDLGPDALFRVEIGIADLESLGAGVRPVGEKLIDRRGSRAAR
jgi:hypothetical protein